MKFLAVCNFGCGSSLILKMTIDKVCSQLDIDAEVDNVDQAGILGQHCDAIFTSEELCRELESSVSAPVIPIKRYMDVEEVKAAISNFVENK